MGSSRKASRLLLLAREIVRREQELGRLRAEFTRLAGDDPQLELPLPSPADDAVAPVIAPSVPMRRPLAKGTTLALRIIALLDGNRRPMTAPELHTLLNSGESIDTIRTTLSKLAARRAISRVGTGTYGSLAGAPEAHRQGGKRSA